MTTVPILLGFNGSNYQVTRSLRFRSSASAYLNRTPASASNRTTWTWSGWVKRGLLTTTSKGLFSAVSGLETLDIVFEGNIGATADTLRFVYYTGSALNGNLVSTPVYRDPSAWYHIVAVWNTTDATSSNRMRLYVNGVEVTAFGTASYPTQNTSALVNNTVSHTIGRYSSTTNYFDGYLAEVNFIDGQALTPSSFGYFDLYGVWQPKRYNGTFGTNGFYLPFSNTTSTTTLVADSSGNGNNWTANNISLTAGTTYDSMIDSPTNYADGGTGRGNYCTWNPTWKDSSLTISDGNLKVSSASNSNGLSTGTIAVSSGKWYWEATVGGSVSLWAVGIVSTSVATPNYTSLTTGNSYAWNNGAQKYNGQTASAYGATYTTGDILGVALDLDGGTITFYKNNTSQGTAFTGIAGTFTPMSLMNASSDVSTNFGQRPFSYTPPTGFQALNTQNLPPSAVPYGAPYMNAITYTGYGPLVPSGLGILTKRNASTQSVSKSLRFRASASAYLNRTPSASNRQTWTWSGWVKRGTIGTFQQLFGAYIGSGTTDTNYFEIAYNSDQLQIAGYSTVYRKTTQVLRDPSAWYHVVVALDTTQATASNRVKLYINGVQVTAFATSNDPALNSNLGINGNYPHGISAIPSNAVYFDGYLAEVNFVDGQALTPSSFGQTNSDGIWVPKAYTGTYGTNGFYLPFTNTTSTTTLVADSSGNGNNWTPNNISLTAGTTYDSMIDSPTDYASAGNYCTMNPLDSLSGTASNGNLLWTAGAAQSDIRGTITIPSSGKFYMECTVGSTTNATSAVSFGLATSTVALNSSNAVSGLYQLYASSSGYLSLNGTNVSSSLGVWTAGDTLQIAVDVDNTKMWLGKNGTWYDSAGGSTGNPSTGANATSTASMVGLFPFSNCYSNNATWNMGQRSFVYAAPTGFTTLNTYNITAPSTTWFSSANNSGNASATAYPDFVWIKSRSSAQNHSLNDTLRGPTLNLITNNVNVEAGASTMFAVNKYGLTLGNDASVNSSSYTDVMWGWQGGNGTTSTNTNGTITSQVSASTTSGFSILTYTGNFTAGATVGHGLGVAPSMILVKTRTQASVDWITYHVSLGPTKGLYMDTGAATTSAIFWNNTSPTASVITLGGGAQSNGNGQNMVAYCWAAIRGFSAFGSYTGNGSTDGPFVYTGFRPRWLIIKRTDSSVNADWRIFDTSRAPYNVVTPVLFANISNAEDTSVSWLDILSNGFKLKDSAASSGVNASGGTYIYAAFAENPFNMSRAR